MLPLPGCGNADRQPNQTPVPQHLETSQMATATSILLPEVESYLSSGVIPGVVGGEDWAGTGGETFQTRDPGSGELLAEVHAYSAADVDRAVAVANEAFRNRAGRRSPRTTAASGCTGSPTSLRAARRSSPRSRRSMPASCRLMPLAISRRLSARSASSPTWPSMSSGETSSRLPATRPGRSAAPGEPAASSFPGTFRCC